MNKTWIFFDLDGTLVDSVDLHGESMLAAFTAGIGFAPDIKLLEPLLGTPFDNQVKILLRLMNPKQHSETEISSLTTKIRQNYRNYFYTHIGQRVKSYEGIQPLLFTLQQRGIGLGIVSSTRRGIGELELAAAGIQDFFKITVFINDISNPKPSPEPLIEALRRAGLTFPRDEKEASVLMVGDSIEDVMTAYRAGVRCIVGKWGMRRLDKLTPFPFPDTTVKVIYYPNDLLEIIN